MTIIQEVQKKKKKKKKKKQKKKIKFQNLQENCLMQEMILLIFLKKELFCIKVMYLKQKKNQKKTSWKKFFQIY